MVKTNVVYCCLLNHLPFGADGSRTPQPAHFFLTQGGIVMTAHRKPKTSAKTIMVRTVCFSLAALMILSVVLAAVWRW